MKEELELDLSSISIISDNVRVDSLNDVDKTNTWSGSVVIIQEILETFEPISVTKL